MSFTAPILTAAVTTWRCPLRGYGGYAPHVQPSNGEPVRSPATRCAHCVGSSPGVGSCRAVDAFRCFWCELIACCAPYKAICCLFWRSAEIGKLALTVSAGRQPRLDLTKGHNPPEHHPNTSTTSTAGALVELSQDSIGMVRFAKYVDGVAVR